VTASQAGKLDAWIDFNLNGSFEANEQILTSVNVAAGGNLLAIGVPSNVIAGGTYARFRLSAAGGLSPTGSASTGEVEDYAVQLSVAAPLSAQLVADPQNSENDLLLVTGSALSDAIIVQPVPGNPSQLRVVFPGLILGPFSATAVDRIEIHAHGGNDSIVVDAAITRGVTIYAGEGSDSVVGGSGDDLIFGEAGYDSLSGGGGDDIISGGADADYLYGGVGNDILLGGGGSDWLFGDGGDDILIGSNGPTSTTNLLAIQAIWSTPLTLNQRAAALSGQLNSTTVTDDGVADYIYGFGGSDWQLDFQLRDYFFDFLAATDRKN
jgi:Ca2+-binding RTX toxin-like protein